MSGEDRLADRRARDIGLYMEALKAPMYTGDENSWELGLQRRCDKATGRRLISTPDVMGHGNS